MNRIVVLFFALAAVSCKDIIQSSNSATEHKIYDEKLEASPAIWRQLQNVTVNSTDNEVISRIVVTDLREDKSGEANIVEGGQGNKTVTIELKSPTVLRGYQFHIEVYAAPEETKGSKPFDPIAISKDKISDKSFTNEGKLRLNIGEDIPAPKTIGDVSTKQPFSSEQIFSDGKRTTRDTLDRTKDSENFGKDIVRNNITNKPIIREDQAQFDISKDIAAPKTVAEASTKQPIPLSSTEVNTGYVKRTARNTLEPNKSSENFSKDTKIPGYPAEVTNTQSWNEEILNKSRSILDSKKDSEILDREKDKIPNKPVINLDRVPETIGQSSTKQSVPLSSTEVNIVNVKRVARDSLGEKKAEKAFLSDNTFNKSIEKPLHIGEKEFQSIDLEKDSKNARGTAEILAPENSTLLPIAKNVNTSERKRYSRDISKQVNPVRQQIPIPFMPDIDAEYTQQNIPISYKMAKLIGQSDNEDTRLYQARNNINGNTNDNHGLQLSPKSVLPNEKPTRQVPQSQSTSREPTRSETPTSQKSKSEILSSMRSTISKRSTTSQTTTTSEKPTTIKNSPTTENPNSRIREFPTDKHVHLTNSDPKIQDYDSMTATDIKAVTPTLPIAMALQPKDESLIRFSTTTKATDKAIVPTGNISNSSEKATEVSDEHDDENYELRATPHTGKLELSVANHEARHNSYRSEEARPSEQTPLLPRFPPPQPRPTSPYAAAVITLLIVVLISGVIIGIYLLVVQSRSENILPPVGIPLQLVSSLQWNPNQTRSLAASAFTARQVAVVQTDSRDCRNARDCTQLLKAMQANSPETLPYNFLVSSNGQTFEALGWRRPSPMFPELSNALVLAFIGNFTETPPTKEHLDEAKNFFAESVSLEKLHPSYYIVGKNTKYSPQYLFKALSTLPQWNSELSDKYR